MNRRFTHFPYRIILLFALLVLAIVTSSCNHNVIAQDQPQAADAVMQTIHDYGQGHKPAATPAQTSTPDLTEEVYQAQITQLVVQQKFAQLEKIAQGNRGESDRLLGGGWKNYFFFEATGRRQDNLQDSDYELAITGAKKWISVYPTSAAARISLALIYVNYANFARGTGYAQTISEAQWNLFNERLNVARETLLGASRLKERDPRWYEAMQELAFGQGWNKAQMTTLLEEALRFEPEYFHYYREHATYLKPQWYGDDGDIDAFAREVASRFAEPKSSILYFRIDSSLACYCSPIYDDLSGAAWPKLKEGYDNLQRLYGTSNVNANRFALMAYRFQDQSSAHDAFGSIAKMEPDVWTIEQIYERARGWALPSYGFSSETRPAGP
jgi:Domain of unknown function (DUF4034)